MDHGAANVRAFYRAAIWLPIVLPAAIVFAKNQFGWPIGRSPLILFLFQILAFSLVYGGIPYFILAVWGSVALKNRSEAQIERLMYRAPLLMASLVVPFYLAIGSGLALGARSLSPLEAYLAVSLMGAATAIPLGYVYVGIVMILRRIFGRRLADVAQ
jgi:hypothetical protein